MTDIAYLNNLRAPDSNDPLRLLLSSCLMGTLCGADGSSYGDYPHIRDLAAYPNVHIHTFCPEDYVFGTPRKIPDIEDGNGADVLDGKAKVINESGEDITREMIRGAEKMLQTALEKNIELAIMMDVSAACGSQVIYLGNRLVKNPVYQVGKGVAAEMLHRNGIKIISQRDYRSLEILLSKIEPHHCIDKKAIDHDESEWYLEYFGR